jgi:hypothetical protein
MNGLIDHEAFASIYVPGRLVLLAAWRDADAAAGDQAAPGEARSLRHRHVRVIRDYGMFDRREAPQFYPEARRDTAQAGADGQRRSVAGR